MYVTKQLVVSIIILLLVCTSVFANNIEIKQVLRDGINSIDGLDNPRQVKADPNGNRIFVISADDNSLSILQFDEKLKQLQLFKNKEDKSKRLEGASSFVIFNSGTSIAVASFYDSAISLFEQSHGDTFKFTQAYSDNVSYERIFKSKEPLANEDTYGLFGAWDIAISSDERKTYVASYKSNAISIFDINHNGKVAFNHKYTQSEESSLGSPTSIALSNSRKELIVTGFESNILTVLSVNEDETLTRKQTIQNGADGVTDLVNPIKVVLSPNERYLYVACSGSNSILVFEAKNSQYSFLQSITQENTGGAGLKGVGSIALTRDGSQLFAAGEMDEGLLLFDVKGDGRLHFNKSYQSSNNKIEGITSIALTNKGNYILLTLGKRDALYLLKLGDSET